MVATCDSMSTRAAAVALAFPRTTTRPLSWSTSMDIAPDSEPSDAERLRAAAVARRAAAVAAARRARDSGLVIPRAGRGFVGGDGDGDGGKASASAAVLGIGPEILDAARAFRRPFATEAAMVEAWHATRDDAREEYKRRRRQALRRRKSLRASGTGAARHS